MEVDGKIINLNKVSYICREYWQNGDGGEGSFVVSFIFSEDCLTNITLPKSKADYLFEMLKDRGLSVEKPNEKKH